MNSQDIYRSITELAIEDLDEVAGLTIASFSLWVYYSQERCAPLTLRIQLTQGINSRLSRYWRVQERGDPGRNQELM